MAGFLLGLPFTQRCGNYFVTMFDDYSATLPLIIVVVFETFSVSWLYGADRSVLFLLGHLSHTHTRSFLSAVCFCRFLDDIEAMLGWRPSVIYKYLWKYICLLAMLGLLGATTIQMFIKHPTYMAWNKEEVFKRLILVPAEDLCFTPSCTDYFRFTVSGCVT